MQRSPKAGIHLPERRAGCRQWYTHKEEAAMYDQHPFELPSWDVLRALDRAHKQGFRHFFGRC